MASKGTQVGVKKWGDVDILAIVNPYFIRDYISQQAHIRMEVIERC